MVRQIPFSKVAESWVEAKSQLVKRSTYCAYSLIIKTHLLPTFRDHSEITECEVQQFVIDKLNSGLKRKTVKDIMATLRAIVRYGEKYFGFPGERWDVYMIRNIIELSVSHQPLRQKSSNREIPIGKELFEALRAIKGNTTAENYVVGGSQSPKEPRTYREYISRLLKRLNIPRIVFHGLRHTFATRCIECMCDYYAWQK